MALALHRGYLHIGRVLGAPVRLHWSIPIGAFVLGRFRFVPWYWAAFLVLVLVHELGHAAMVWGARARVVAIEAHGAGGICHWSGEVSEVRRALIAWGGVLAQALLLGATYLTLYFLGPPESALGLEIVDAFTESNLWLIAVNLIPIPGFDGASAWPLLPALARWVRERRADKRRRRAKVERARAQVAKLDALDDPEADPVADELLRRVFEKKTEHKQ
jgi:Zn-dependent protease